MPRAKGSNSHSNGASHGREADLANRRKGSYTYYGAAFIVVVVGILGYSYTQNTSYPLLFSGTVVDEIKAADVDKLCDRIHHWGFQKGEDLNRCAQAAMLNAEANPANASAQALAGDVMLFFDTKNYAAAHYFRKALEMKGNCVVRPESQDKQQECMLEFQSLITALRRTGGTEGAQEALGLASQAASPVPSWKDPWQLPDSFDPALTPKAFWTADDNKEIAAIVKLLEDNYKAVRQELENMIAAWGDGGGLFQNEASAAKTLARTGNWTAVTLKINKKWRKQFCEVAMPLTCSLLRDRPDVSGFIPGQFNNASMPYVKLYRQTPGTHLRAHYGMTNSKLTAHLGLIVPEGSSITVRGETRSWEEGKVLVFDDSFEHEAVTTHPTQARYVLNVGFWHPELHPLLEMPQ